MTPFRPSRSLTAKLAHPPPHWNFRVRYCRSPPVQIPRTPLFTTQGPINMKPTISRSLATKLLLGTATLLLFAPFSVDARTRPQYGGRAIVQLNEPAFELDPASTQLSPEMRNQI